MTRITWERTKKVLSFSLTGLSPSMVPLTQRSSANGKICNLPGASYCPDCPPHNPLRTTDTTYHVRRVWAVPRSLATTSGIAFCFLFLEVLRCFSSLGWLRPPMYSAVDRRGLPGGVAPFGNPRMSLLPAARGLSQVATSFIASQCQGIHRVPLVAWPKPYIHLVRPAFRQISSDG